MRIQIGDGYPPLFCQLLHKGVYIRFTVCANDKSAPERERERSADEPETGLSVGEILPGTADESKIFYRNDEDGSLCVGYMRGDFGKQGDSFWHSWFDCDSSRNTLEFKAEFQNVMSALRQDILKDYKSATAYCYKRQEAKLPGIGGGYYGFKLETKECRFFIRCTTRRNDYFYIFAYDKAAPMREQERFTRDESSVMKQIHDAQKAPKLPRKEKLSDKQ